MGRIAPWRLANGAALVAVMLGAAALGGCKILTIDQDRALRARSGGDFDAQRYVDAMWASQALPAIQAKAVPAATLASAIAGGVDAAGARYGRRVGEGSAWTFALRGEGVITSADTASPHGTIDVALAGDGAEPTLRIETGPIVTGTAIRDALPSVAFNDFPDQLVFADVGRALTARALAGVRPLLGRMRPGSHIRFLGVANVRESGDPMVVTPVSITIDDGPRGS